MRERSEVMEEQRLDLEGEVYPWYVLRNERKGPCGGFASCVCVCVCVCACVRACVCVSCIAFG